MIDHSSPSLAGQTPNSSDATPPIQPDDLKANARLWHSAISEILQAQRFEIRKGDVGRVALLLCENGKLPDTGPYTRVRISAEDVAQVAEGVLTRLLNAATPTAKRVDRCIQDAEAIQFQEQTPAAIAWIVARVKTILAEDQVMEQLAKTVVGWAVKETACILVVTDTGYDKSTAGKATRKPYDLAGFNTLGDFLEEATEGTAPTYESGHGLTAPCWDNALEDQWQECLSDARDEAGEDALTQAPEDLQPFFLAAHQRKDFYQDFLHDNCFLDVLAETMEVIETVRQMDFRTAITRFRPDALLRLQKDIQQMDKDRLHAAEIESRAEPVLQAICHRFRDQKTREDKQRLATDIATAVIRCAVDKGGVEMASYLCKHRDVLHLMTKSAQRHFEDLVGRWLFYMRGFQPGPLAARPLLRLFQCLDDLKVADGRDFYVTITYSANGIDRAATFGSDNWPFLQSFALTTGVMGPAEQSGVIIRRFEKCTDAASGLPLKTLAGCGLVGDQLLPLTAAQIQDAHQHDTEGNPVAADPLVRYVDAQKMCPELWLPATRNTLH